MVADPLEIEEHITDDSARRLTLLGELDAYSSPVLRQRLNQLAQSAQPVRLDLSRLDFADSSGMAALVLAMTDASENRWQLEIEPQLSPEVARIVELWGAAEYLWPD